MKVEVTGIEHLQQLLREIGPKQATNLMRSTVHGMAGEIRNDIKKVAPKDTGALKKQFKAKSRRAIGGKPRSDVVVETDGYYWRFLEYGFSNRAARPFIVPAFERFKARSMDTYLKVFGKKYEAALARRRKKANGG